MKNTTLWKRVVKGFRDKYLALATASLFLSILSYGQKYDQTFARAFGVELQRLAPKKVLLLPTGCSGPTTSTLTATDSAKKQAAIYYDSCYGRLFVFNPHGATWDTLTTGGGGTGTADSAIFATVTRLADSLINVYAAVATKLNISDTANKWVGHITKNIGGDSLVFYIGATRYAVLDRGGGGSGGTDNANVGSGFRIIKPSTQEVKTLFGAWGVTLDSSSNTNGITATVDSSAVSSKANVLYYYNLLNASSKLQGVFDRETGGSQLSKGDTITTHAASENGLSLKVYRPSAASYGARTFSRYAFNVYGASNKFSLLQDGQLQLQNPFPFWEVQDSTGTLRLSGGWDPVFKHSYLDMVGSTDFLIEHDGSSPWLYAVGKSSNLFPSRYWGNIAIAGLPDYNVIIGNGIYGDPSAAHDKDSKLTVYGNIKSKDSIKAEGQFHAYMDLNVRGVSIGTGLDRDSTNTAVGNLAMANTTSGSGENSAFGFNALSALTSGVYNTGLGVYSLYSLNTGVANTSIGQESMPYITNSWNNSAFGYGVFASMTSGSGNVGIGAGAGWNQQLGSKNIHIYARSTPSAPSAPTSSGLIYGNANVFIGGVSGSGLGISAHTNNNVILTDGDGNKVFWDDSLYTRLPRLAGSGTRMVTADVDGKLSTQALPAAADSFTMATRARVQKGIDSLGALGGGSGVSSIAAGFGTSFSTITSSGSVIVDSFTMATRAMIQKKIDSVNTIITANGYMSAYHFIGDGTSGNPIKIDSSHTKVNFSNILGITGTPDGTKFLRDDGSWQAASGSGTPGGSTTQIQYNNAGAFAGISGATTDGTKAILTNPSINNVQGQYTTVATAAGTTTLTVTSTQYQNFTGTTTQTVVLPNATTMVAGMGYYISNISTGQVTVNMNGGTLLKVLDAGTSLAVTVTDISSSAGSWVIEYSGDNMTFKKTFAITQMRL